jgi:hypothetical protein
MKIVPTADVGPGICCVTGTADGPFIELDRLLDPALALGGVCYVSVQAVEAMAWHLGLVRADDASQERVKRLEAERDEAREAHFELLQAVGTTLKHGAVVRHNMIELRKPYDRTGRIITHKGGGRPAKKKAPA